MEAFVLLVSIGLFLRGVMNLKRGESRTLAPPTITPAATYSPTQLPTQYHRPWKA